MTGATVFPRIRARTLQGLDVDLPDAFVGSRNIVIVAFRREHQTLVDSWVPFFEMQRADDPALGFYEVPTIGRMWAPVRNFIDGGMATAIRDPEILQRTMTIYGDVSRVTEPLAIEDRSTITVLLLDGSGRVQWTGTGGLTTPAADELATVLDQDRQA